LQFVLYDFEKMSPAIREDIKDFANKWLRNLRKLLKGFM